MSLADFILNHIPLPSLPLSLTHYDTGRTPLSTWTSVLFVVAGYLAVIFGVQEVMRPRKPLKLTALFQLHNIILSSASLILLVLTVEEIAPILYSRGVFYGICGTGAWTPKLEFYYMINYYFKYLELLDTLFLVLKKKQLVFLHVYHHAATALLCYAQLNSKPSASWVPVILNLTVHVLMYYYYFAAAGGRKLWWKKYLTSMQITQFIIDLIAVCLAGYFRFLPAYFPKLPTPGTCFGSGSLGFGIFSGGLITSYLFLFISFYDTTYKKPQSGKGTVPNGIANGTGNGAAVNNKTE